MRARRPSARATVTGQPVWLLAGGLSGLWPSRWTSSHRPSPSQADSPGTSPGDDPGGTRGHWPAGVGSCGLGGPKVASVLGHDGQPALGQSRHIRAGDERGRSNRCEAEPGKTGDRLGCQTSGPSSPTCRIVGLNTCTVGKDHLVVVVGSAHPWRRRNNPANSPTYRWCWKSEDQARGPRSKWQSPWRDGPCANSCLSLLRPRRCATRSLLVSPRSRSELWSSRGCRCGDDSALST